MLCRMKKLACYVSDSLFRLLHFYTVSVRLTHFISLNCKVTFVACMESSGRGKNLKGLCAVSGTLSHSAFMAEMYFREFHTLSLGN